MVDLIMVILKESVLGCLGIMKSMAMIVIPLMIVIQIMTDYKWLERLSLKTKFITDFLGVSKDTLIPILIGMCGGISYGAGAIIIAKEQYGLGKNDIFLAMCFLAPFHALFETTLIFWAIGANPAATIAARLCVAISVTLLFKYRINRRAAKENQSPNNPNL